MLEMSKCHPILTGRALAETTKDLFACPEIERKKLYNENRLQDATFFRISLQIWQN